MSLLGLPGGWAGSLNGMRLGAALVGPEGWLRCAVRSDHAQCPDFAVCGVVSVVSDF